MYLKLSALLCISILSACSGESTGVAEGSGTDTNTGVRLPLVEFTEIGKGNYLVGGSLTTKEIKIVSTAEQYYEEIYKYEENPPELDFGIGQVLLINNGSRPSSGYAVEVVGLTDARTYLLATVYITEPGESCAVDDALTNPYHIIYVPLKTEITVAEIVETTEC